MSVMHFSNALVWEIIGPAMAGSTGPCATPMILVLSASNIFTKFRRAKYRWGIKIFRFSTNKSWAVQPGDVGGQCPPPLGPAGYRGYRGGGPLKMIFASTANNLYSVLYK